MDNFWRTPMRRFGCVLCIVISLIFTQAGATSRGGGIGLIYVHSARSIQKGFLEFAAGTRYFGKVASLASKPYTLWNVQGSISFNYGISDHVEFFVSPIIYQDTNSGGGNIIEGKANLPDDLFVGLKIASFGGLDSPFRFGGRIQVRFPTANTHNIVYEPYAAGRIEVGVSGLVSYYSNTVFPDEGWSLHGNVGYVNHNDVGVELTDDPNDPTAVRNSQELLVGMGMLYPAGTFDFSGELNIRTFLVQPPGTAFSRENMAYFTAGVFFKPARWITFSMGFDLLLFGGDDASEYMMTSLDRPPEDFPNYPSWRGVLGVKLALLPLSLYRSSEAEMLDKRAMDRRAVLERMMQDQRETEGTETELEKIRAERKKLEDDLRRIRKMLEEEKKKKKKKGTDH